MVGRSVLNSAPASAEADVCNDWQQGVCYIAGLWMYVVWFCPCMSSAVWQVTFGFMYDRVCNAFQIVSGVCDDKIQWNEHGSSSYSVEQP